MDDRCLVLDMAGIKGMHLLLDVEQIEIKDKTDVLIILKTSVKISR